MNKILLTGGAGFIGSHVVDTIINQWPDADLTILDKMTYAAHEDNLKQALTHKTVKLIKGDICNFSTCRELTEGVDLVLNLAAESHVDNSFGNSLAFTHTNVLGTHTLMEACRINQTPKIVHVSTDEVYGDILSGSFHEGSVLNPTNPYSASKAGAEMIIRSYISSFKLPVVTVRANNIYGPRQFPEKIIPKFSLYLHKNKKIPIHGNGENLRTYLSVYDFAEALLLLIKKADLGGIYNIGSSEEYTNLEIANIICGHVDKKLENHIEFVPDRPFNDKRYSLCCDKIKALGWGPRRKFTQEIGLIVNWYKEHSDRYQELIDII